MMSEDYYNPFTFSHMISNNTNLTNLNSSQYSMHTLQNSPLTTQNQNYGQLMQSNSGMNPSYLTLGSAVSNSYGSKIISRTSSFNSSFGSTGSSSSSSPSSSVMSASANSQTNLPQAQSHLQTNMQSSSNNMGNNNNGESSYDIEGASGGASSPNDLAEIARLKQARGIPLTSEEAQLLAKDRQRKDNHNMSKI